MTPRERNARLMFISSIMAERRMRAAVMQRSTDSVVPFNTASRRKARRKTARASRRRNRVA